jgi:hypothetical protein
MARASRRWLRVFAFVVWPIVAVVAGQRVFESDRYYRAVVTGEDLDVVGYSLGDNLIYWSVALLPASLVVATSGRPDDHDT